MLIAEDCGEPLVPEIRSSLEKVFASDLSELRIHISDRCLDMGLAAFTHFNDVYFAPGLYQPGSPAGLFLLAHEIAHTLQQRRSTRAARHPGRDCLLVCDPALEREANAMACLALEATPRSKRSLITGFLNESVQANASVIQPFTLNEFKEFVAQMEFLGDTGYKLWDLDISHVFETNGDRARFMQDLFTHFNKFTLWNDRFGARRADVEEEVGWYLAQQFQRPQLIPPPDQHAFGAKYFYLFRGTTEGFAGHANGQSPCSISPVVSVSFALKSPNPGGERKILQIYSHITLWSKHVTVIGGNPMAGYEQEVVVNKSALELKDLAIAEVPMSDAIEVLRGMGIQLPTADRIDPRQHDEILLDHGRMPRFQVDSFIARVFRKHPECIRYPLGKAGANKGQPSS
jgi:hypothetical protein